MLSGLPSCKDRLLWQEKDLHLDKDKASCTAREVLLLRGLILWGKRMQLSSLCELSYDATLICLHNCLLKLNVSEYTMDTFPATLIKQFYFWKCWEQLMWLSKLNLSLYRFTILSNENHNKILFYRYWKSQKRWIKSCNKMNLETTDIRNKNCISSVI